MWIVNVNGKWFKTDSLEKLAENLKKPLKPLKDYIELDVNKIVYYISKLLSEDSQEISLDHNFHILKIKKTDSGLIFSVYLKIPSAKKKVEIDSFKILLT